MAFDARHWRSERLRLLQKLQANIDTARWLREQSTRTVKHTAELMDEVDRARSERAFDACRRDPKLIGLDDEGKAHPASK